MRDGSIRHCYDLQGASAAALHENNFAIAAIGSMLALKKGGDLDEVRRTRGRFAEETSELWERVVSDPLFEQAETAERTYKRGRTLSNTYKEFNDAVLTIRKAIKLNSQNPKHWNSFGVLLQYHLSKFQEAEHAYFKALELNPENDEPITHGNLAFLYWLDLKRPDAAKHHADLAGKGLDECGKQLLEVARLLAEDSLGLAWRAFDSALTLGGDTLWDGYGSCLKYILRYVHNHGYSAKFQSWMEAADYPARFASLYWAFWALREGEAILLNVNPEVRSTAEKIYQGLAIGKLSESPAQKPQRRRSTLKRTL